MPAWLQAISFFGPQKLPFYGWLINGIIMFGFAGWLFWLLGRTVVPMYANYIDAHSTKLAHADDVGNLWMLDNSRICKRWWMA